MACVAASDSDLDAKQIASLSPLAFWIESTDWAAKVSVSEALGHVHGPAR
jgi:hypothetical protein